MATGRSILDNLNAASKGAQPVGPSGKFRTKDLPIAQLYRNEGNFYAIVEIEELAGMILASGLLENLTVVYDPGPDGQYRIVSGERRWEALKLLVSRGYNEFAVATCNIRPKRSQEEETVDLIAANSQRVKSITDQLQEWPVGSYRIDIVAIDGEKKVAIECDGERWHSSDLQVRNDMERQTILERLGWRFIRIRGSEYFRDPEATITLSGETR